MSTKDDIYTKHEKLEAENERLLESRNYWKALHHELRATNERLRAALHSYLLNDAGMSTRSGPRSLIERAEWIKHSLTVEASDILTELVDENERLRAALDEITPDSSGTVKKKGKKTAPTSAGRTYT